jgi:hypothetical protein
MPEPDFIKKFPKDAEEFYNILVGLNKDNIVKINKKAVKKIFLEILDYKKWIKINSKEALDMRFPRGTDYNTIHEKPYYQICGSIRDHNDKEERRGALQIYGTCPNCKNPLCDTGGVAKLGNKFFSYNSRHGRCCLNCKKYFFKENLYRNYFTEIDEPCFIISRLKI